MTEERKKRRRLALSSGAGATDNADMTDQNKKSAAAASTDTRRRGSGGGGGFDSTTQQDNFRLNFNFNNPSSIGGSSGLPIVSQLIERGYLVDSKNWLKKKGFLRVGQEILAEIIKSLKADKLGMHETHFTGSGNIIQENSKKYEYGNEISNININSTITNFIERKIKNKHQQQNTIIEFPLDINYEDLEIYETIEEIQVATVYCIDLQFYNEILIHV